MPTSYTSLLGLALPVTGELSGTWGDTVNDYITQYLDASVAGTQTISGSQTAVTLSKTTATSLSQAGSGATGSSQYNIINCTGNPASMLTVTVPAASKTYVVVNATSTNQDVKIVGAGPTTGVTLVAGEKAVIAWNGSDFIKVATSTADGVTTLSFGSTGLTPSTATSGAVTVAGTLVAANGGTGQSSYTTGDLLYATGSTALSKLGIGTNGQILTSTGTAPQWSTLSGVAVTTFSAGTTGFTPSVATSGAITLAGTLATTNGGTGLTSFTANRVFYASSTSAIGQSANLTFDGTTLTANALTTTSTVTINGGTANGVAYLNGSKVLTTGGTLTFDGTTLRTGTSSTTSPGVKINMDGGGTQTYFALTSDPLTIFSISRPSGSNNLRFDANYGGFVWGIGSAGTATEAMALTSTGLGIGTSSPGQKLTVAGNEVAAQKINAVGTVYASGAFLNAFSTAGGNEIGFSGFIASQNLNTANRLWMGVHSPSGANQSFVGNPDATPLAFWTNSVERIRITSAGDVGIGTSSPASKLDVSGGTTTVNITSTTTSAGAIPKLRFNHAGNDAYSIVGGGYMAWLSSDTTERMRLDSSGNLGLGVTPSTWTAFTAIQVGPLGGMSLGGTANNTILGSNVYFNAGFKYAATGSGTTYYQQTNSEHRWYTAPSGTAGNAISFTQAMTLDASGNLGVGTTSIAPAASRRGFVLRGNSNGGEFILQSTSATDGSSDGFAIIANGTDCNLYNRLNGYMGFGTNNTERARITSGGQFAVSSAGTAGAPVISKSDDLDTGIFFPAANELAFAVNGVEELRITSAGFTRPVAYADTVSALGNTGTATTINLLNGNVFTATLTGNCTFTLSNPIATGSSSFTLILTNDGTAGRTVAWAGGSFVFPGGAAALSRTTTANAVDVWVFFTPNGGTTWYGNIAMKDMKA